MLLVSGNVAADHLAGEAAAAVRLSGNVRAKIFDREKMAYAVRMKFLITTLETLKAEQILAAEEPRGARVRHPGPRPPAPLVCKAFSTQHSLSEGGRACTHCKSSTTIAKRREWLDTPCFDLRTLDGNMYEPPPGRRVHICGGFAHESHRLKFHAGLGIWFCARCGSFAAQQLAKLGELCPPSGATGNRRDYLNNIERGIWPKAYSKAEKARRAAR